MPYPPDSLLDPVGDDEVWRPHYQPELEAKYPVTKAYGTICFTWFCKLCVLVNETYVTIYNGRLRDVKIEAVSDLEARIRDWYKNLPECLRFDNIASVEFCPPPHIMCLK
jgi:hypothetical protein